MKRIYLVLVLVFAVFFSNVSGLSANENSSAGQDIETQETDGSKADENKTEDTEPPTVVPDTTEEGEQTDEGEKSNELGSLNSFQPMVNYADDWTAAFSLTISYDDGRSSTVVNNDDNVEVDVVHINAAVISYTLERPDDVTLQDGDTYTINLPSFFDGTATNQNLYINGVVVAQYSIIGGQVIITFNEAVEGFDDVELQLNLSGDFDTKVFEEEDEIDVEVPYTDGTKFTATIKAKGEDYVGQDKKEAGNPYILVDGKPEYTSTDPTHIDWTVRVNDNAESIGEATVVDDLGANLSIVDGSFKLYRIVRNWNNEETRVEEEVTSDMIEDFDSGFKLKLGGIEDAYDVEYTTQITRPVGGGEHTINNSARIILDDSEEEYEDNFSGDWAKTLPVINKEGIKHESDPHLINWIVEYNYGKENLGIVTLTDTLSANHGEIVLETVEVYTVNVDRDGNVVGDPTPVTLEPVSNDDGSVSFPGLDTTNGQAYLIKFSSNVPVGLNETITNTVTDNYLPEPNTDSARVPVDTIPTGGKVGQQYIDDEGNPYIEWTITLNSEKVNVGSINVMDVFNTTHLNFDVKNTSLFELYKDDVLANNFNINNYKHDDGREGFELTINNAGPSEYKFVYRTYYTTLGMQEEDLANEAELVFQDGGGIGIGEGQIVTMELEGPKAGIYKWGNYTLNEVTKEQEINWSVVFNSSEILLKEGDTLTEEFTSGNFEYIADSLILTSESKTYILNEDYTLAVNGDKKSFVVTLKKDTNDQLTLTFRTTVDDIENKDHVNKATLKWRGGEQPAFHTVDKREPGSYKNGSVVINDDGSKTINWTVNFNTNKHVIHDFKLTDNYTPATVTVSNIKISVVGGDDVTEDFKINENPTSGSFVIEKESLEAEEYQLSYSTTLSPQEEQQAIKNTANIEFRGGSETPSKEIASPSLGVEKDAVSIAKNDDNKLIIEWKILVNTDSANHLVNLVDATLTDTIPSDQKLIGNINVVRADGKTDVVSQDDIVYENNKFMIALPDGAYQYTVTFNTEVLRIPSDDLEVFDKYNNSTTLENQIYDESGLKKSISDSAWIRYYENNKNELTGKSGEQNQDTENIDYIVTINPEGLTIDNAQVKDSLSWHHQYEALLDGENQLSVEDSIFVTKSSGGKLVNGMDYVIELAEDNRSFTISFKTTDNPDGVINEALTITYSTRLNPDVLGKHDITNETVLTGGSSNREMSKKTHTTTAQQWFYGGGGSGRVLDFSIKKIRPIVENENPEILPGAEFKLVRISANGAETVIQEKIVTTTDLYNAVKQRASRYKLIETSAPKGFIQLADPLYFTVGYSQDDTTPYILTLTDSEWKVAENPNAFTEGNVLTIVNEYVPLDYSFEATKTLTGTDLVAGEFEFVLLDSSNNEVDRAKNDGDGLVSFKKLTFTQPGEYIYKMSEVDNGRTGMTYDDTILSVTLTIVEGENGLEVDSVVYKDGTEQTDNIFENEYEPLPTNLVLTASKELDGRNIVDGEFTFSVNAVDENGNLVEDPILTATNDKDGNIYFDEISYTEVGTHNYVMFEVKGEKDTVEYDQTKIYFTVKVTDNDGQLEPAVSIKDDATFEFNNSYTPKPTSLELKVSKLLEASKHPILGGRKLQDDEFKFNLYSVTGEVETLVQADVGNNEDGSIPFEALNFIAVGTYNYRIREVVGSDSTIIYDTNAIDVTVVVEDDEGQLVATPTYKLGETTLDEAVFTNTEKTYAIGDYTWIDANKDGIQDADEKVLEGVTVELYDDKDELIATTETNDEGLYIFDELVAGTYKVRFVLTEQQAALYEFTQQVEGDNSTDNSDANPITGWTVEIVLYDDNEHLTKDYEDQEVLATQGIDPTWDAGVILRERTEVSVFKEWVGLAEETVEVTLYRQLKGSDLKEALHVVELSAENDWTHTWENLYVDVVTEDGKVNYVYTVEEAELDRYLTEITCDATNGFVITNTRKTYAIGDYTWIDTNKDGIQDEDEPVLPGVIVELYDEKGNKIAETTTDEKGRYRFDELEAGTYRVKFTLTPDQKELYEFTSQNAGEDTTEDSDADVLTGWTVDIVLNDDNEYLTSNEDYEYDEVKATMGIDPTWDAGVVLRARTTVTVTKVWVGGPTEKPDVEVVLLRNGAPLGDPVTLNDQNEWTHTWENLYVTDEDRETYVYTVAEVTTEGYLVDITGDADSGFVVTNTRKTYAIGDYTWIDTNKDGIQDEDEPVLPGVIVELYDEKGNKIAETTTDEKGRYLFDDLEAGTYRVKFTLTPDQKALYEFTSQNAGEDTTEDSDADILTGWTKVIVLNEENEHLTSNEDYEHGTVKATMGVDPTWDAGVVLRDLAQLTVQKVWENAPKVKPSVKVQLYRNGEAYGDPVTLNGKETTPWSHTWTELYVTDEERELYVYTVDEIEVPEDYKKAVDGFVITNTYEGGELPDTGVNSRLWTLLGGSGVLMAGAYLLIKGTKREED